MGRPVEVSGVQGTYSNLLNGVYTPVPPERWFADNWSKLEVKMKNNRLIFKTFPIYEKSNDFGTVRLYFAFDHWVIEGNKTGEKDQNKRLMQSIKDNDKYPNVVDDVRTWEVARNPDEKWEAIFGIQQQVKVKQVKVTDNPYKVKEQRVHVVPRQQAADWKELAQGRVFRAKQRTEQIRSVEDV
jgi:hypothetical protein